MTMKTTVLATLLAGLAASTAGAQYPIGAAGFAWTGSSGATAGNFCWGANCIASAVNVTAGESVTLHISGEIGAPYAILTSTGASNCQPFLGILNRLVLDAPVAIGLSGALVNVSPILSCPNGYDTATATFPTGLPIGLTFAIQGITYGAGNALAFTKAILVTVI